MQKKWIVSSSPHLKDNSTTSKIMLDVCIALAPAGIAGIIFFGLRALLLMVVCVLSAMVFEGFYQRLTHQKVTVADGSAAVTGLLLAYNLPATAPVWIAILGSFIAIIVVKQIFGGLGHNFMNPALAARAILFISWLGIMAKYPNAQIGNWIVDYNASDVISGATPLFSVTNIAGGTPLKDLFIGNIPGVLGETSKVALLLGGLYLLVRKVIDWRIPVFFIGTVFVAYLIKGAVFSYNSAQEVTFFMSLGKGAHLGLYQILSGGLMLGAFFMATDYVTSPVSNVGRIIMGIGCGIILFVIRAYGAYPEGCSFAILFMNVLTPLIDKLTVRKNFGEVAKNVY